MVKPSSKLQFLDGMRGIAAIYVVIFHAWIHLWAGSLPGQFTISPALTTLPQKLFGEFMLLFSFGHEAVMFFFVLSGFVIHLRYAKAFERDGQKATFDWLPFVVRRFRRIYPALIVSIMVILILDHLGMFQHYPIYFAPTIDGAANTSYDYSALAFIHTLLQGPLIYGTGIPLWSLKLEWWFYMIYPLFWWLSKRSLPFTTVFIVILFGLSFIPSLWIDPFIQRIFSTFVIWWMGVLLAEIYAGRLHIPFKFITLLIPVAIAMRLFLLPRLQMNTNVQEFMWGLLFTGVIAGLLAYENSGRSLAWLARLKFFGDFSYTLYITHYPVIILIAGWFMSQSADGTLPWVVWPMFVGALIAIVIAYLLHFIGEKPFMRANTRPAVVNISSN